MRLSSIILVSIALLALMAAPAAAQGGGPISTTITNTTAITSTVWSYEAPSGNVITVENTATFGDLLVASLITLLLGVEIVALTRRRWF